MGFRVLKGGLLTTVQDLGRTGYQSQGFSVGGVMDTRAFRLANLLLDNPENEAVLEITLLGPELEFTAPTVIAVTGGDFSPALNGRPVPMYTALYIRKGDVLRFGGARTGTRGCIAFSGGLDVPVVMGSRSTSLKCRVGGFQGRRLEAGDVIEERRRRTRLSCFASRKLAPPPYAEDDGVLRVVMGPQDDRFTRQGVEAFLGCEYTVTGESDRMGCRLEGPEITPKETSDILSDGIAFGAVQVSSAGKPIVLLADRQTTGGYAKIATVISADLPRLVQKRMDQKVRFRAVTVQEAREACLREAEEIERLRKQIHTPDREIPPGERLLRSLARRNF